MSLPAAVSVETLLQNPSDPALSGLSKMDSPPPLPLPIGSMSCSINAGRVGPGVSEVHTQQAEGQTQALVEVDGMPQLEPVILALTQGYLCQEPPNIPEDSPPHTRLG